MNSKLQYVKLKNIYIIIVLSLWSCSKKGESIQKEKSVGDIIIISDHSNGIDELEEVDYTILSCDSTEINGKKYMGYRQSTESYFYVVNENMDTIYKHDKWVDSIEFIDFNNDGESDILFNYVTNIPMVKDVALFNSKTNKFTLVENFSKFPDPKQVSKTGYYYSYQRAGCADHNWVSDLFIIKDYQVLTYGRIHGIGCETVDHKTGVFIYKLVDGESQLIDSIPLDHGYNDEKCDFIEKYWTNNYKKFI
ncbi:hypothetical protein [Flammeovirga aprica]|uniref:Uncharacterized protein n=1 Tax=Flammeovirga aprica JL-4 TaxID=694437 RepID=A0A7X9RWY4_9BACT|nr:hypothetical protein [Flammeovirga aprica]NME70236.1 hypothetical protein [Flammeovirga aprica JL-4]